MIEVDGKIIDFIDADWKICVVLDACGIDAFRNLGHIIPGELKMARTFCAGTQDWMYNNIYGKDCSKIVYIDPIIMFNTFIPTHNFFKVVMAWKTHWDYNYGTILPEDITTIALENIKKYPDKRFIVHYHQPHPPYLLPEFVDICEPDTPEKILETMNNSKREKHLSQFIQGNMRRLLGSKCAWNWMIRLGVEPTDYAGKVYKVSGWDGLVRGYEETLKRVLKDINRLIKEKNGKMVVTSDHSKNYDGSMKNLESQYVPWVEIK